MNDLEAIRAAYSAFEQKMPMRSHQMGAMEMDAVRAAIDAYTARAAQSAPGAVSRASGLSVEIMAERDRKYGMCCMGAVPSCAAGCAVEEAARRDACPPEPRAEAAPRGTPAEVAVAEAAYREGLTDARDKCLELGREMGEHPEWARTCADAIDELLAAPRAPEPSPQIDSLTELETEAKPSLSECMRVAREAVERAGFVYPANPREVAREAAKAVYELFTRKHLPTCGWFQWPDGRVGQDGECKCPELRAPEPEAGPLSDKEDATRLAWATRMAREVALEDAAKRIDEEATASASVSQRFEDEEEDEKAMRHRSRNNAFRLSAALIRAMKKDPPRASEDGEGAGDLTLGCSMHGTKRAPDCPACAWASHDERSDPPSSAVKETGGQVCWRCKGPLFMRGRTVYCVRCDLTGGLVPNAQTATDIKAVAAYEQNRRAAVAAQEGTKHRWIGESSSSAYCEACGADARDGASGPCAGRKESKS